MPSNFDKDMMNGEVIEASHVAQYAEPIRELESGKAFYRVASGDGTPYLVDFQADADPDVRKHHLTTDGFTPVEERNPLEAGQVVVFKANADSPDNATLQLVLEDGSTGTNSTAFPLTVGDDPIQEGDILENQIVVAIYNDTATPRFDVVSLGGTVGGSIDQFDDVDVSTSAPVDLDILQYDGPNSTFVNRSLGTAGIVTSSELQTELNNQVHDAVDIVSGQLSVNYGGTGADLSGTGGAGQVLKQESSGGSITVGPLSASDIGGGNVDDTEFGRLDGVTSPIQGQIDGKQDSLTGVNDVPGMNVNLPQDGDLLQYDSSTSEFKNEARSVNTTAPLTGGGDLSQDRTISMPAATSSQDGYLSQADFATFDGKQDALSGTSDVPGLDAALAGKEDVADKGQPDGYAELDSGGKVPLGQLPSSGMGAEELNDLSDVDVTTPVADHFLKHDGTSFKNVDAAAVRSALGVPTTSDVDNLAASDISNDSSAAGADVAVALGGLSSGVSTNAANISTNTTDIGNNASSISANTSAISGKQDTLTGVSDVPGVNVNLPQDGQILQYDSATSEFKNESRSVNTTAPLTGGGDLSEDRTLSMPAADGLGQDGYLTSAKFAEFDAKEDAANKGQAGGYAGLDGTSGAVPLDQGGTGADLSATGGAGQVLKQSSSGGAISVEVLSAGDMPSGIDATKIGGGSVDNTEFGHLDGVNSSIQGQLDSQAGDISTNAGNISTNAADISTNSSDIATNASNLSAHTANTSNPHSVTAAQAGAIPTTEKGAANGVAPLDASGFVAHEDGGLEADVSAYEGLVKISGGATSQASPGTDYYAPGGPDIPLTDGGTGASDAAGARTNLDVPSKGDLTSGLAGKADVVHTHVASDITDFDQAVSSSLAAAEWAHFPLLDSDLVASDLSDTDIGLGVRNAGDQLDRNGSGRVVIQEGLYVVSFSAACEINSGGPLEVGVFDYSGPSPVEISGSIRARYGDFSVHGTVVGDAVIAVPSGQSKELGLRTGGTATDGKIISGDGFFKIAKLSGGMAANGQTNALNDLSDVQTNSPATGDLLGFNGSVFTNQSAGSFGFAELDGVSGAVSHEQGGLEADVSGYSGLVKISGGATSQATPGSDYYAPGSTDVSVADGGTGASNASGARANLGLAIGSDVQAQDALLDSIATLAFSGNGSKMLGVNSGATAFEFKTEGADFIGPNQTTSGVTASTSQSQGNGAISVTSGKVNVIHEVSTCANADDTVTLPSAAAGLTVLLINNGVETLQVFPASGDNLGEGVDTSTTIESDGAMTFVAYDSTNWRAF